MPNTNFVNLSKDPSGYIFYMENKIFRHINFSYKAQFIKLSKSGLYRSLVNSSHLVPHRNTRLIHNRECYKIISPKKIDFISYPYEWSFSQLKDAAILTLDIQLISLKYGMILKDASAFNVQFQDGKPIFIDILSFDFYKEGSPWVAYRQFCQHFLAPLALMAYKDIGFQQLFKNYIDGIPLDFCSKNLPLKTYLNIGLLFHIHLHANIQKKFSNTEKEFPELLKKNSKLSKSGLVGIINSLRSTILKLEWNPGVTEWQYYYKHTNYNNQSFRNKKKIVSSYFDIIKTKELWDLGGNVGLFSRIASNKKIKTLCFDIDPAAVESNYLQTKKNNEKYILPLLLDLTNPTPSIGWSLKERESILERGPADTIMALALCHHICISNNIPLEYFADFLSKLTKRYLIIEFVPKEDSQVQRLLRSREDIFVDYHEKGFEKAFLKYFTLKKKDPIIGSIRSLYLFKKKQ